jgi:tetratricopeptide (TPR) repeat protein
MEGVVLMSSASDPSAGPKNPKARTFFNYGNDAAQKANFDYAIQMYREACKLEPGWLQSRQMLRGIERRKFGNEPSKVGRLVGARTQPIKMKIRSARSKANWTHMIEVCEEVFVHNPWDISAARDAAEAAEQLGHKELAQWFIESVQSVANDIEFFKHAAHIFEINASWPKAIAAWERVKKINPDDDDANRQINALSASATIQRSGLGDSLQKRAAHAAAEAGSDLNELKQPQLSPEERWQKEIQDDPTMVGPYLHYAEQLKFHGQLDEAQKLLAKGLKAVSDDPSLHQAYADIQIARLQNAISAWTRKVQSAPDDPASKAKLDQLQTMLTDYEIKEFQRRVKLHPDELKLQFELGLRLAKAGQHRDAIAAFQQARGDAALRVEALHQAGQSFEAEGQLKLAERNYQEALKAADAEDTNLCNALHYRLGRVSEAMGNTAAAEEHYNEVAANDYGYLDVAQRLRGLT